MNDAGQTKNALTIPEDFASKLMAGIAQSRATTQVGAGGKPILRLLRGGVWVFGQTNEELQPGSRWVVNPMTLAHGWCCWVEGDAKNTLAGDVMVSMAEWLPEKPAPINGTEYKEQRAFELKCLDGDDAGTEVIYKVNSYGGIQAVTNLIGAIQKQLTSRYPCPVLTFESEWYTHPKWGRVDKPIFNIVGWANMNGQLEGDAAPELSPTPQPAPAAVPSASAAPAAPVRKRKAPIGAAAAAPAGAAAVEAPPVAPAAPQAPQPTAQAHVGQRRRPGAR